VRGSRGGEELGPGNAAHGGHGGRHGAQTRYLQRASAKWKQVELQKRKRFLKDQGVRVLLYDAERGAGSLTALSILAFSKFNYNTSLPVVPVTGRIRAMIEETRFSTSDCWATWSWLNPGR
jgi:hypothetical protein